MPSTWEEAPSWASTPMSPSKREAYRVEMQTRTDKGTGVMESRLAMYQTRKTRAAVLAPPVDESTWCKDSKAQALKNLDAELPTLVVQRHDRAVATNNTLRFVRDVEHGVAAPLDGGPLYGTTTLEANWVEEKRDKQYHSEWHVKELRRNKLWDTENTANFVMHCPDYTSKLPALPKTEGNDAVISYANEGFGEGTHQDHTAESKRGGHWIGVAPIRDGGETITTTAHGKREYLEFQMRTGTSDPKASFLGTLPGGQTKRLMSPWTQQAHVDLAASQRYTTAWKSMYNHDFLDYSKGALRASSTLPGWRQSIMSLHSYARPQTAVVQ